MVKSNSKKNSALKNEQVVESQTSERAIEEPTELKVARISFKQAVIVALITSSLAIGATIFTTIVNKPSAPLADEEAQYLEQSADNALDELRKREDELNKAKEEVQQKIENEQNPEKKKQLKEVENVINNAAKFNRETQREFSQKAASMTKAKRDKQDLKAAMLRKDANEILSKEGEIRSDVIFTVKPLKLDTEIGGKTPVTAKRKILPPIDEPISVQRKRLLPIDKSISIAKRNLERKNRLGSIDNMVSKWIKPEYPQEAKDLKITGTVRVEVIVDENGNVLSATAVKGHALLLESAEKAALQLKFKQFFIAEHSVGYIGVVNIDFIEK